MLTPIFFDHRLSLILRTLMRVLVLLLPFLPSASAGELYDHGQGVKKDQAEAKNSYDKSLRRPQLPKEVVEGLAATSSITLYSLQPWGGPDIPEWDFHGHHSLGHVALRKEQARMAVTALNDAVSAGNANLISGCRINPRHALQFKIGGNTFDILICYQCGQLEIFKNDLPLPFDGIISGKPDVFNGLLEAANIPLADTPASLNESYAKEENVALEKANEGDAKAQEVVARLLMSGRGVKKNEAEGIKWFAKSLGEPQDNLEFQIKLARMYEQGQDVAENYSKAMNLLQKAAAQGSAEAQYQIGELYEVGEGVAKNPAEAIKRFRQAAENENAKAQYEIGVMYAQGREVKQDYLEALKWLRKAANQGHPEALYWMGVMYEEGRGVRKDPAEAYFWDRLAVAYGTIYGTRISVKLTPEQLALVDKRLANWTATHAKRPWGWQLE